MGRITVILLCVVLAIVVAASPSPDVLSDKLALPIPLLFRPSIEQLLRSEPGALVLEHGRHTLYAVIGLFVCYHLYQLLFRPFYLVRALEDRGYVNFDRQGTIRQVAEAVTKRRKRGDLPPVYPNGWFRVCESNDVKVRSSPSESVPNEIKEGARVYIVEKTSLWGC